MRHFVPLLVLVPAALCFSGVFKGFAIAGDRCWNADLSGRLMERMDLGFSRFEGAWSAALSVGDPASAGPEVNYTRYRLKDFEPRLYPGDWSGDEGFSVLQNLDRFSLQFRPGDLRVTAGRQAIYWGVSKTVSPTDFIAPFPYGTIDTEYRVGVDALRAVYPLGVLSEVESGAVFGQDSHENGFWARTRLYALRTDASVIAARYCRTYMAGGSLNRALGGSLGWVEGAWNRHDSGETWWSLSAGAERSFFQSRLYCYAEYHFNSAGDGAATEPYENGTVYLTGRHYASSGLSLTATPLLTISTGLLFNAGDLSSRISADMNLSLSDNGVMEAGFQKGWGGEDDEFQGVPLSLHGIYSLYF